MLLYLAVPMRKMGLHCVTYKGECMKSCLKRESLAAPSKPAVPHVEDEPSSDEACGNRPKSVSFSKVGDVRVFYTDDWDHLPEHTTRKRRSSSLVRVLKSALRPWVTRSPPVT
ncbi:hypothetical protein A0H81_05992 [Grifola frondosa]|uniref:Uncharacterized protein n=1 Tax=Grifola frondosa TaxID=5627 RepID=A0A1C7MAH0_GRIFR|nr:hypothetical protein A0H81_05992 [Grifola frondosa]